MGAGKTSAARAVAAELGAPPVDSDALIEERLGSSIEEWFASHGERAFREPRRRSCSSCSGARTASTR